MTDDTRHNKADDALKGEKDERELMKSPTGRGNKKPETMEPRRKTK